MPVRTELIWDGKYDANGKRVVPLRVPLPFQTVETINETAQDRQRNLFQQAAQKQPWRNRLIGATRNTSCRRCFRSSPAR